MTSPVNCFETINAANVVYQKKSENQFVEYFKYIFQIM